MAGTSLSPGQAAGLGFATSAINTLAKGSAQRQNIKNKGEAARANIGYAKNDYLIRSNIAYEQQKAIQREVGDIMSQTGIEAMKAEASIRTAGAGTGLSGSSVEEVVNQTGYDELLQNKITIARGRSQIVDTFRSRLAASMDMKAVSAQSIQSTKNNLISNSQMMMEALSTGINTATTSIMLGGMSRIGTSYGPKPRVVGSQVMNSGAATPTKWGTVTSSNSSYMSSPLHNKSYWGL